MDQSVSFGFEKPSGGISLSSPKLSDFPEMDSESPPEHVIKPRRKKARMSVLVDLAESNIISSPKSDVPEQPSGLRRSRRIRRRSLLSFAPTPQPAPLPETQTRSE